jgi:hypothetical protein
MKRWRLLLVALGMLVAAGTSQAGVRLGIGLNFGFPCYRPCYYGPAVVYAAP